MSITHLGAYVLNIQSLTQNPKSGIFGVYRKSGTWLGQRELRLFKLLMKYITDPSSAEHVLDLILPFFSKKDLNPGKPFCQVYLMQHAYCASASMKKTRLLIIILRSSYFCMIDECLEALRVVGGILANLRCGVSAKILNALNPLLATAGLELRLCICDIYVGLSFHEPSVSTLVIIDTFFYVVSFVATSLQYLFLLYSLHCDF